MRNTLGNVTFYYDENIKDHYAQNFVKTKMKSTN